PRTGPLPRRCRRVTAPGSTTSIGDAPRSARRADAGRVERRRRAERRRRMTGAAYAVAVGVLALSIPVLGYLGARTILDSSDGEVVDPILDPTEPGYRALIQPSPTMLLVHEDPNGDVVGAAVLALA